MRGLALLLATAGCSASLSLPPLGSNVSFASSVLVAPQCPPGTQPGAFGPAAPGFLAAGDDVLPPGAFTLANALQRCKAASGCAGVTFDNASAQPVGVIALVYFKSRYAFSGASGWWSYPLCAPQTLRHCDSIASADYPSDDESFDFVLVAALNGNGAAGSVSVQSLNVFGGRFLSLIPGAGTKVGIVATPDADDASWLLTPGLHDPANVTLTTQSKNANFSGLVLSVVSAQTNPCGVGSDVILAAPGAAQAVSQTWAIGAAAPLPPPPPPSQFVIDASVVDHVVKREFMGCHMDPGYTQDPLGWTANLVYGQAFETSPSSRIFAWNDATSAGVTATVALDTVVHVNPNVLTLPALSVAFLSGSGIAGWSNRGIGNEGLSLQAAPYEGYVLVLAPQAVKLYVGLHNRDAKTVLDSIAITVAGAPGWQQVPFALSPSASATCGSIIPGSDATVDCGNFGPNPGHICIRCAGEFVIGLAAPGSAHIGFSQLVPGAWGSFAKLPVSRLGVETLQQMGITTIRQGGSVSQSFRWKDWLPVSKPWLRPSMGHTWGNSLVGSWGPFEFVDMCMAAHIKPILTLAWDLNTADDWADLIEFMYGDNTTTWGRTRIADGHPQIYDLQTLELGNEQENPDFVAQVTAIEARRAAPGVNAPEITFMYPTNGGVSAAQAAALSALPGFDVARIAPDCHVGGGGGVGCAEGDFAALPGFLQSGINVETNAAISDANRMIMEASDLQVWFNVSGGLQARLRARAASFCLERSGHFDAFDQGIAFFLPNMTWLQPPGWVHAMITHSWQPNAVAAWGRGDVTGSAQLSDDGQSLTVQLVNPVDAAGPMIVSLSIVAGFTPSGAVNVFTLAETVPAGTQPDQKAGNSPSDPMYIAPVQSMIEWPAGQAVLNVTLPPFSFTVLELFAGGG
jgi:hypothetical protein